MLLPLSFFLSVLLLVTSAPTTSRQGKLVRVQIREQYDLHVSELTTPDEYSVKKITTVHQDVPPSVLPVFGTASKRVLRYPTMQRFRQSEEATADELLLSEVHNLKISLSFENHQLSSTFYPVHKPAEVKRGKKTQAELDLESQLGGSVVGHLLQRLEIGFVYDASETIHRVIVEPHYLPYREIEESDSISDPKFTSTEIHYNWLRLDIDEGDMLTVLYMATALVGVISVASMLVQLVLSSVKKDRLEEERRKLVRSREKKQGTVSHFLNDMVMPEDL